MIAPQALLKGDASRRTFSPLTEPLPAGEDDLTPRANVFTARRIAAAWLWLCCLWAAACIAERHAEFTEG